MSKKILIVEDEFVIADVLSNFLQSAGYQVCGLADSVPEALDMIEQHQPDLVLLDIYLKGKLTGIDLAHRLSEDSLPFVYISANSNQKVLQDAKITNPYGFVVKPFREKDVLIAIDIAFYRHQQQLQQSATQHASLQKKSAHILVSEESCVNKLLAIAKYLQPYIPFEFLSIGLRQEDADDFYELSFSRIGFDDYQVITVHELMVITNCKLHELAQLKAKDRADVLATWYDEDELQQQLSVPSLKKVLVKKYHLKSHLSLPIILANKKTCYFNFYSRRADAYQGEHLLVCNQIMHILSGFLNGMFYQSGSPIVDHTAGFTPYQPVEIKDKDNLFQGIIGRSHLLLSVFDQVTQVAGADSAVLILGESGTGKEKIAERIHALSSRKDKPFIRINCAVLPATLIDSELFGHEKGAFTGAHERKIGKFEQAHTGTIFLDEIGELPLESQSKLLRVLQEKEIERIGGRGPIKINVRVIAATNRKLDIEVAEGRFRLDLYYRINVFPILMPALRERKEDIAALATHFLKIYARKTGKTVTAIAPAVISQMEQYQWPGNIRELENLIERNVLLTREEIISTMVLPTSTGSGERFVPASPGIGTMQDGERTHILSALKKCNGKIWGEDGAARLLDLPPTTLNSKMKKLGIRKDYGF